MTRSSRSRSVLFVVLATAPLWLLGCPKKPVPVEDAGEAPPPAPTPTVTTIAPLSDDGPDEADVTIDTGKKWTGPPVNANQLKIRACCSAMRATHDPMFFTIAAQCDLLANQVGPQGSDPAFAQLRAILRGAKLPGACSGM